jgi:hypothetical protein
VLLNHETKPKPQVGKWLIRAITPHESHLALGCSTLRKTRSRSADARKLIGNAQA